MTRWSIRTSYQIMRNRKRLRNGLFARIAGHLCQCLRRFEELLKRTWHRLLLIFLLSSVAQPGAMDEPGLYARKSGEHIPHIGYLGLYSVIAEFRIMCEVPMS